MRHSKVFVLMILLIATRAAFSGSHVALGSYTDYGNMTPHLFSFITLDLGKTWAASIKSPQVEGAYQHNLTQVACDQDGQQCVSVGYKEMDEYGSVLSALSYFSIDGGETWLSSNINLPANVRSSYLTSVTCDSNGQRCVAVGAYSDQSYHIEYPLSYTTTDGGKNWELSKNLPALPDGAYQLALESIVCGSDAKNCIAIGNNSDISPLAYTSNDSGQSWSAATAMPIHNDATFYVRSVACASDGLNCIAVGDVPHMLGAHPFSYITTDGGKNWQISENFADAKSTQQQLASVACDSTGKKCVAVGKKLLEFKHFPYMVPLIFFTTNGGQKWEVSEIESSAKYYSYSLLSVACDKQGKECIAVGHKFDQGVHGELVSHVSHNGGKTWTESKKQPTLEVYSTHLDVKVS